MFALIRVALLSLIGFFLAVAVAFFGLTEQATAPSEQVPALVQKAPEQKQATTTLPVSKPRTTSTPTVQTPQPKIEEAISSITKTLATIPAQSATSTLSLNDRVRAATVNILCQNQSASALNSISASGVVVDPRGIILTNSHVAQYLLLKDYPSPDSVQCIVRVGSPAEPRYRAELLFLPPSWIAKNAQKILDEKPLGNGEHDYALIRITGTTDHNASLPVSFSFLRLSADPPTEGQSTLIAGYPAGFLGGAIIQKDLYAASSFAQVGQLYTFMNNTIDIFSVGGSVVAQQGSSGGAVADQGGTLIGIITTSSEAAQTSDRDLRALSTSYIIRDFASESGTALGLFLDGDTAQEARSFAQTTAPSLTAQLVSALGGK